MNSATCSAARAMVGRPSAARSCAIGIRLATPVDRCFRRRWPAPIRMTRSSSTSRTLRAPTGSSPRTRRCLKLARRARVRGCRSSTAAGVTRCSTRRHELSDPGRRWRWSGGAGQPLTSGSSGGSAPGRGEVLLRVHACGVCRTDLHMVDGELPEPSAAARSRARDRRHVVERGAGVTRFDDRRSRRRALARLGPAASARTAGAAGEPVRCAAVHRLHARRRLCGARRRRRADYCFRAARGTRRRARGAAAVRGTDRLSRAAHGRRCPPAGHLRFRRGGAHRRAGGAVAGARGLRLHPAGDRAGQDFARSLGCDWAGGLRRSRRPSRWMPRSSSPRSGRWCRRRCGDAQGRHRRLRRHPHERHSRLPLSLAVGRAHRALGRQPDPRDGEEFLALRRAGAARTTTSRCSAGTRPMPPSSVRHGRVNGAAVLDCR